jgi:large subunit ribosomal protein L30
LVFGFVWKTEAVLVKRADRNLRPSTKYQVPGPQARVPALQDEKKIMTAAKKKIQLKYIRSKICTPVKHKLVIKGLGFTRLNQVIEREDTPSIRGMVAKVPHLVQILEQ